MLNKRALIGAQRRAQGSTKQQAPLPRRCTDLPKLTPELWDQSPAEVLAPLTAEEGAEMATRSGYSVQTRLGVAHIVSITVRKK